MSDEFDEVEDGDSEGIKNLRKRYDEMKKELSAAQSKLSTYEKNERRSNVAKVFEDKDVDPKYAKFYDNEDSSPEAVLSWLEENADLVHYAPKSEEQTATEASAERISQSAATAPPQSLGTLADLQAALEGAKTREEYAAAREALMRARVPARG